MCTIHIQAQTWISLTDSANNARGTDIEVLTSNANQYVFKVTINGFYKKDIVVGDTTYNQLYINEYETMDGVGYPELPVVNQLLGIPKGTYGKVTVSNISWQNLNGYTVYPLQRDLLETETANEFARNANAYNSNSYFPSATYSFGTISDWGGIKIRNLILYPFRYRPVTSQLRVMKEFTVKVDFIEVEETDSKGSNTGVFGDTGILPLLLSNYNDELIDSYGTNTYSLVDNDKEEVQKYNFLIISAPQYKNDPHLINYLTSKAKQGYACKVVSTDETGTTPTGIKDYIRSQQVCGVKYVLLIGNHSDIPVYRWPYSNSPYTANGKSRSDYWYGCMGDDTDYQAEIAIGRFCVSNSSELYNMINKNLSYRVPNNMSNNWIRKNVLVAHKENAPNKYQGCLEDVRNEIYNTTPEFLIQYGASPDAGGNLATNSSVVNQINQGVGIVTYRGHGTHKEWREGWSDDNTGFDSIQVNRLSCPVINPIVFSVACKNARITMSHCLMESFTTKENAAVAFWGATEDSYTNSNDYLIKDIYKQIYNNGVYRIGDINLAAQTNTINFYSTPKNAIANAMIYLWGGDPTLEIWTDNPNQFSSDNIEVIQNKDSVTIFVEDSVKCDISLCSMEDLGLSYFQKVEGVSSYTFSRVDVPCYINVNKHNYIPYTFNKNVTINSKIIDNKSALVGNNITIESSTITNGGTLTIKADNTVTLGSNFNCELGGTLIIQ